MLREAGRPAGPGSARLLLCRDRIAAAEPGLRELVARLAVPLPVTAQGVAAASTLLTDAAGPLYNRRSPVSLGAAMRTATGQLDPAAPLLEPGHGLRRPARLAFSPGPATSAGPTRARHVARCPKPGTMGP